MTSEAGWPGRPQPGWATASAPALERAEDEVRAALRGLLAADDVAWSSPAATSYRAVLADGVEGLRVVQVRLDAAYAAAARHDAAVAGLGGPFGTAPPSAFGGGR